MDIFKIFRRPANADESRQRLTFTHDTDGLSIHLDRPIDTPTPGPQDLLDALDGCTRAETILGGYLLQLVIEGQAQLSQDCIRIDWENIYKILEDQQFSGLINSLGLPQMCAWQPVLDCQDALSDPYFRVFIKGWVNEGRQLPSSPQINGAIAETTAGHYLLPRSCWELTAKLQNPLLSAPEKKSQHDNEVFWGEIRALAIEAGAFFASQYLEGTVVLTPKMLRLGLTKEKTSFGSVYIVNPTFSGAPNKWLPTFDKFPSVQPHYDVNDGGGRIRVIISEPVKKVLEVIKRDMPGRRVAGAKAEKIIKNPFSFFGEETAEVIDREDYEATRDRIGPLETTLQIIGSYDRGRVTGAVALITEIFTNETRSFEERIGQLNALKELLTGVEMSLAQEREWHPWREFDLTLDANTHVQIEKLKHLIDLWEHQSDESISPEDIFELAGYSERIEGVGYQGTIYIPALKKDPLREDQGGWVDPNNLTPILMVRTSENPAGVYVPVTDEWADSFEQKLISAESGQVELVHDGHLPSPLKTPQARLLLEGVRALLNYKNAVKTDSGGGEKPPKSDNQKTLIVKTNFDRLDYIEERSDRLTLPEDAVTQLPSSLKPTVKLKDHQLHGVSWFQHLISKSPLDCRGALLADDMGLGKTIQLLSVLGRFYEENPDAPPSIVFAPKSLLENWSNEVKKFFTPKFPKSLILYGKELARLKQPQSLIDEQLKDIGITDLLRPGWIEDVKIFFTSYEVLTSYQFSFAKQKLSFIICDEAQRIKTPGTMVTLAVKKLNAQFRVACTGTPVENSLNDLWCLFDFIQPGLLGTLDQFSHTYRRPIECNSDELLESLHRLQTLIRPQILRRTKEHIRKELKGRYYAIKQRDSEQLSFKSREELAEKDRLEIPMCDYQVLLYKGGLQKLRDAAQAEDQKRRVTLSFGALHLMKAVCAEPYCLPGSRFTPDTNGVDTHLQNSPKLKWVMDHLQKVREKGEKAIIFTELREAQLSLYFFLRELFSIKPFIINGDSDKRQEYIDKFSASEGFDVIILSTLAAGAGLNVTAANHVFHFTRAWNPAKENQATDRAYRIGQERDVYVYCPTMVSDFPTFELRLDELMRRKASLADSTLDQDAITSMLNGTGGDIGLKDLFENTSEPGV